MLLIDKVAEIYGAGGSKLLKDKVAVIYGAGGAVGGAVARAFAREGARLFLTGRHQSPVEAVAKDIVSAGGSAEAAEVDALDEQAVDKHLQSVIDKAGRSISRSTRSGSRTKEVCLWSSSMSSSSPCRSRPTRGRMTGTTVILTMGTLDD